MTQGLTYSADIVLVIDATGSMGPVIERVKTQVLAFYSDLDAQMKAQSKFVDQVRIRVIAYRDFYADGPDASLIASPFFSLPEEQESFASFVRRISAEGGGDEPETGLEALAEAIRSPWTSFGDKKRQIIVVWTDASNHPLEKNAGSKPRGYPDGLPANLDELTDWWDGQSYVGGNSKRLLIYAPDSYGWSQIGSNWENTIHYASRAGEGLAEVSYKEFLSAIASSV